MVWRSYDEYQWDVLRHLELYEEWKREDFHWLIEGETKAVRYMLHVIWDLLNLADELKKIDEEHLTIPYIVERAMKYFTFVAGEIRNKRVVEILADRFKEHGYWKEDKKE